MAKSCYNLVFSILKRHATESRLLSLVTRKIVAQVIQIKTGFLGVLSDEVIP